MRTWRKLYASILDSEQIARLSDAAYNLFTMLIAAQDDSGYYPWTDVKVRRLIAARPSWTVEIAQQCAEEMITTGLATWQDGGIVLVNGAQRNGKPRGDRAEDLFARGNQMPATDIPLTYQGQLNDSPRLEQSRVEKSREEKKSSMAATRPSRTAEITLEDIQLLKEQYPGLDVDAELENCQVYFLNEVTAKKRGPPNIRRFRNWLKNALKYQEECNGRASNPDGRREASTARSLAGAGSLPAVDWGITSDEVG